MLREIRLVIVLKGIDKDKPVPIRFPSTHGMGAPAGALEHRADGNLRLRPDEQAAGKSLFEEVFGADD